MRDARQMKGDACVGCVRRMRRIRVVFAQIVTHASVCDAGASYRVGVTHASVSQCIVVIGEALLNTKKYLCSSTGVGGVR